jgi:sugar-specific transcriptional regulator TrmB
LQSNATNFEHTTREIDDAVDTSDKLLLQDLGLTESQVKVFVLLAESNGLSSTEISKLTRLHRSDTYRALKRLTTIGVVEVGIGSPSRYFSVEPIRAVRILLDLKRNELSELETKSDTLIEWLETRRREKSESLSLGDFSSSLFGGKDVDDLSDFRLVRASSVTSKIVSEINSAKEEIVKVVSALALRRHYVEFCEYERKASLRGVKVLVLTEINSSNSIVARKYSEHVSLNHVSNLENSLRYLIVDRKRLILAGTRTPSADDAERSVLCTSNRVLVNGCLSYFQSMWAKSKPAAVAGGLHVRPTRSL